MADIKPPKINRLEVKKTAAPKDHSSFLFKNLIMSGLVVLISVFAIFAIVKAGNLNPSSNPAATFYTLGDIYSRLITNATSTEGNHVFSSGASPAGSLYTLEQIYGAIPTIVSNTVKLNTSYLGIDGTLVPSGGTATTTQVCSGQTYYGANQSNWTLATGGLSIVSSTMLTSATYCGITGNIATQTLSNTTTTVAAGYYNADNLSTLDLDLAAGNIKSGVNIFGIGGSLTPDGGTATVADLFNGKTANLTADWNLDTGTLNLACNVSTFNGTTNLVPDAYDGSGNGANRWCMATSTNSASVSQILSGYKAWVNGAEVTGNIATQTLSSSTSTVSAGYYNAVDLTVADSDLASGNIKSGINIFGISGNSKVLDTSAGTAAAGDMLSGKVAFSNGSQITGNIATQTLSSATTTVNAGYYNATNLATIDANLAVGNIKSGISVFGVAGTLTPNGGTATVADLFNGKTANLTADWIPDTGTLDLACNTATFNGTANLVADTYDGSGNGANRWCMTDSGTATSSDILSGKIAWVNGVAITGNVTSGSNVTGSDNLLTITIPNGLYSGSKTATATSTTLTVNNIKNGISIFGVAGTLVPSGGTATTTDVCSTKTYFGANQSNWTLATGGLSIVSSTMLTSATYCGITGNIATQTLSSATTTVSAGYYNATTLNTVDTNLNANNILSGITIFGINGTALSGASLVDTGQTKCYDLAGAIITCGSAYNGQDAQYTHASSTHTCDPSYTTSTVSGVNVVTDNCTGLMWRQCSEGQSTSTSSNCSGSATTYTWDAALSQCLNSSYAGYSDWRLPNVRELPSIVRYGSSSPAIDLTYFPNTPSASDWSASTYVVSPSDAWYVSFGGGGVFGNTKSTGYDVRCVRQ